MRMTFLRVYQSWEVSFERLQKPKPHTLGLQVPFGIYPDVSEETGFGALRKNLGEIFHDLAKRKECKIEEGQKCDFNCQELHGQEKEDERITQLNLFSPLKC